MHATPLIKERTKPIKKGGGIEEMNDGILSPHSTSKGLLGNYYLFGQ